ncbi:NUDIX domain-containing protein [Candidatus Pacearchaeota archaeon]|nr:NUDIX domain-containing protein [Candidatus Pacearchaeota archaeon]
MEKRKTDLVVTGFIFNESNEILLIHHNKLNLWLPVGGHIEQNETPDEALLREIKEETNLDVEIVGKTDIPLEGNVKANLASVCKKKEGSGLKINKELESFKWVPKGELGAEFIPADVGNLALKAFEEIE